jgi:hypothetical protein
MTSSLLHTYDHYLYALVALGRTACAAAAIQWLLARSRWAAWAGSLHGVALPSATSASACRKPM